MSLAWRQGQMSIPTNDEVLTLLDRLKSLTADDLESQWLDFKPWQGPKDDMKIAVEYAACFANAEGGVVVCGGGRRAALRVPGHGHRGVAERFLSGRPAERPRTVRADLHQPGRVPCWTVWPSRVRASSSGRGGRRRRLFISPKVSRETFSARRHTPGPGAWIPSAIRRWSRPSWPTMALSRRGSAGSFWGSGSSSRRGLKR